MLDRMFMGAASGDKIFVEDVFSTYLYRGTGAAQTINNGIDLAGKGGMVWIKSRSAATNNFLFDTTRGVNVEINSNTTDENATLANSLTAFNSNGFSISSAAGIGVNAATYASWTFREAPNFFDVVTWSGNGTYGRTISHNLGVAPGCIVIKHTSGPYASGNNWVVWHRSDPANVLALNTSGAATDGSNNVVASGVTATSFQLGGDATVNREEGTYVAYLYAHDATADGVIQCGSFTTNGSGNATVNLGYEPQWLMAKCASDTGNWFLFDTMRGLTADFTNPAATLFPNLTTQEVGNQYAGVNATGFVVQSMAASQTYIYIAIRRGPMRTPTLGTSVFAPVIRNGTGAAGTITAGINPDLVFDARRDSSSTIKPWYDKLRGATRRITSTGTAAEDSDGATYDLTGWTNTGYTIGFNAGDYFNQSGGTYVDYVMQRAPGFFDEVCYTGTGVARTVNHNLGVAPELMIGKGRSTISSWPVYSKDIAAGNYMFLNLTLASSGPSVNIWGNDSTAVAPTSTVFTVGNNANVNGSGTTYVAYLFASCPGVSKVGSYTGNGSSQTINCGFAAGARFVMIKRTDSTGDWYVWDTARGIVAGNDPHLSLNTTAAEVTSNDTIDTDSSGFVVNQVAATNVNVNAATYIYLAIA